MTELSTLIDGVRSGSIVPYLGPGVLADACELETGTPMPADSDSLILAMNGGRPMAPKLMYEFSRAAMNLELKRGRSFITRFLNQTYDQRHWRRAAVHEWLACVKPPYVIDINRDTQLQTSYADTPHTLIRGLARLGGTDYRFQLHEYDGTSYCAIGLEDVNAALPMLFKPLGSPVPEPTYVASDADFVDYITELMGGFAVPAFIKDYRKDKQYLFIGLRFTRDTERMVMTDIIYGAGDPAAWALIPEPTEKEVRFCKRMNINIVHVDTADLLKAAAYGSGRDQAAMVASLAS